MRDVIFIDPPSRLLEPHYIHSGAIPSLVSPLRKAGYDVGVVDLAGCSSVGFSVEKAGCYAISYNSAQRGEVALIVSYLREKYSDALIVGGGIDVTICWDRVHQLFDVGFFGEGEAAFLAWLERGLGSGVRERCVCGWNYPVDYDRIAPPDYSDYLGYKLHPVSTMRGCGYSCAFCAGKAIFPRIRKLPLSYVESVAEQLRGHEVMVVDDIFFLFPNRAMEVAKILAEQEIVWRAQTRVDIVPDVEYLKEIKHKGCEAITLGLESGSQKVLDLMGKDVNVDEVFGAVARLREAGLLVRVCLIVGFPGEMDGDIKETFQVLEQIAPDEIRVSMFVPYPGCRVWREPEMFYDVECSRRWADYQEMWMSREKATWLLAMELEKAYGKGFWHRTQ